MERTCLSPTQAFNLCNYSQRFLLRSFIITKVYSEIVTDRTADKNVNKKKNNAIVVLVNEFALKLMIACRKIDMTL